MLLARMAKETRPAVVLNNEERSGIIQSLSLSSAVHLSLFGLSATRCCLRCVMVLTLQ